MELLTLVQFMYSQLVIVMLQRKIVNNSKFNFFWENFDIDQALNMINKETKVKDIGLLFGFCYYNYLQIII